MSRWQRASDDVMTCPQGHYNCFQLDHDARAHVFSGDHATFDALIVAGQRPKALGLTLAAAQQWAEGQLEEIDGKG